jgi:hypothetical protein
MSKSVSIGTESSPGERGVLSPDGSYRVGQKKKNVQFCPSSEELLFATSNDSTSSQTSGPEFEVQNRMNHKIRRLNGSQSYSQDQEADGGSHKEEIKYLTKLTKTSDGIFQHRSGVDSGSKPRTLPFPEFWWCQPSKSLALESMFLDNQRPIVQYQARDLCTIGMSVDKEAGEAMRCDSGSGL